MHDVTTLYGDTVTFMSYEELSKLHSFDIKVIDHCHEFAYFHGVIIGKTYSVYKVQLYTKTTIVGGLGYVLSEAKKDFLKNTYYPIRDSVEEDTDDVSTLLSIHNVKIGDKVKTTKAAHGPSRTNGSVVGISTEYSSVSVKWPSDIGIKSYIVGASYSQLEFN